MRDLFIKRLVKEASKNKNIVLLVRDLGFNVVEPFKNKFPNRFYNAGVSEQSMIGIASGLALNGYHVFVYSIANFLLLDVQNKLEMMWTIINYQ